MAIFPCDFSAHRYPGRQQSLYVTSAYGSDTETAVLRLCPVHFEQLQELAEDRMAEVDPASSIGESCEICGKDKNFAIFATFYPTSKAPVAYALDCCAACWQQLRVDLKVASGRVMAKR